MTLKVRAERTKYDPYTFTGCSGSHTRSFILTVQSERWIYLTQAVDDSKWPTPDELAAYLSRLLDEAALPLSKWLDRRGQTNADHSSITIIRNAVVRWANQITKALGGEPAVPAPAVPAPVAPPPDAPPATEPKRKSRKPAEPKTPAFSKPAENPLPAAPSLGLF